MKRKALLIGGTEAISEVLKQAVYLLERRGMLL